MPARAEAGRYGDLSGVQPHLLAERAVEAHEGRPGARRRARSAQVQHRRVPPAPERLSRGCDRARAVPGEIEAPRRVEGCAVQRRVRRRVQPAAARAGPPVWMAFAGVLHEVARCVSSKPTLTATTFYTWREAPFQPFQAFPPDRSPASSAIATPASAPTA